MINGRKIGLWLGLLAGVGWAFGHDEVGVFGLGQPQGRIDDPIINEASGLVASRAHAGSFWTHNDSGDGPRFFLIDGNAHRQATYYLPGVTAVDWEDIGMMERGGSHYLLIGDIGDNRGERPDVRLHVVKEPDWPADAASADSVTIKQFQSFVMRYEDGPRDAESLFFDPVDQQLYIISKRDLEVGVYGTPLPDQPVDTLILRKVCTLPHTFMTSAAISADGSEVLAKNLLSVFYWKRRPGDSIADMLRRPALQQPYRPEPQGEAIAFAPNGSGYYTIGEAVLGMESVLYFYPRR